MAMIKGWLGALLQRRVKNRIQLRLGGLAPRPSLVHLRHKRHYFTTEFIRLCLELINKTLTHQIVIVVFLFVHLFIQDCFHGDSKSPSSAGFVDL
jgi:hypothetical protein